MNKPKHVINRLQNYTQDACAFNDINSIIKLIISQNGLSTHKQVPWNANIYRRAA